MGADQRLDQKEERETGQQLQQAVERDGQRREVVLPHPTRGEGNEREPEQQVQVGPQNAPADVRDRVQQMVVIVPIHADEDEAQDVAREHRQERADRREVSAMRHLHLEHHDRDDDGKHAITEAFEPVLGHPIWTFPSRSGGFAKSPSSTTITYTPSQCGFE